MSREKITTAKQPAPLAAPSATSPKLPTRKPNACPRCSLGSVLLEYGERTCVNCGFVVLTANEYASGQAWLASIGQAKRQRRRRPRYRDMNL